MTDRTIRLSLDINVLFADLLATRKGFRNSASTYLVDIVRDGECPAGPVQLITSVPVIENWASVLERHFHYDRQSADEAAWYLYDYAVDGPLGTPPNIVVGSGHHPFATEQEEKAAASSNLGQGKLFDEIEDDRHVLLGAIGGSADLLATADVDDFSRGSAITFTNRTDVVLFPTAHSSLVIAKPAFVVHWLRQGVVPDHSFLRQNAADFHLPQQKLASAPRVAESSSEHDPSP